MPVPGLSGVTAVAASYGISMALLSNGTVMDWGENGNGQLGDGTTEEDTPTPVQVFRLYAKSPPSQPVEALAWPCLNG